MAMKKQIALCLAMAALLAFVSCAWAAPVDAPHAQVRLIAPQSQWARDGKPVSAGLYFKLEQGWHIYWVNAGDSGQPPHLSWSLPQGISASAMQFPAPALLPMGPLMDYGYVGEVVFPFSVQVAPSFSQANAVLKAHADWLVCREICVPGKADLELTRPIGAAAGAPVSPDTALYARFARQIPRPLPSASHAVFQASSHGFRLLVETKAPAAVARFYPFDANLIDNAAAQKVALLPDGVLLDLAVSPDMTAPPEHLSGVIEMGAGRAFQIEAAPGRIVLPASAAVPAPAAAAAPMPSPAPSPAPASLPASGQQAGSSAASISLLRVLGLAFVGGLILNLMPCVFPVLFLKGLSLVNAGREDRRTLRLHGFVYTAGIVLSFWLLVAVLLLLRAAGSRLGWGFQFQSPVFLALMSQLLFFLGLSLAGQFEIGLTLTSAGGGLASKSGSAGSFFTGVLAVVVATPCTAPFMGVATGYALSQPAVVTFVVFTALALGLAAPYVALTFQPSWTRLLPRPGPWMEVLKQAVSVPIFATVIWLAWVLAQAYGAGVLAALLAEFLLLAIAGWILGRWPARRAGFAAAGIVIACGIALSVMAPRNLATEVRAPPAASGTVAAEWAPWSSQAVASALQQGHPVLVDFTANWCLSCQVNERVALHRPEVEAALRNADIVTLRADWTRHDEQITRALSELGRSGVPAYVLYTPDQRAPSLLPEVLSPAIVINAVAGLQTAAWHKAQ